MNSLVAIDDTGSPGSNIESIYLRDSRKTHVALLLTAAERTYVEDQMVNILAVIKEHFGPRELHFVDIYNGNNEWQTVERQMRISIFHIFFQVVKQHKFQFIVQTCDPDFLINNGIPIDKVNHEVDGLRLTNHHELSLFFLLVRCKSYIEKKSGNFGRPVDFAIDQGIRSTGYKQKSTILQGLATNDEFVFHDSKDFLPLQLADFGAFCLNRSQLLAVKGDQRTDFDNYMLELISDSKIDFVNIKKTRVNISELDKDYYDYFLYQQCSIDGSHQRKRLLERIMKRLP